MLLQGRLVTFTSRINPSSINAQSLLANALHVIGVG